MLSEKHACLVIKILLLLLVAAISFFWITDWISNTGFVRESMERVDESSQTVMKFSAATLSASLAISALPDDFATPLAENLADMNGYFIAILIILFLEKILIQYGVQLAFAILIPCACITVALALITRKSFLTGFAVRLGALGLAVAFVVPCSTHITDYVASDLTAYVETTINETEDGANKMNQAMENGDDSKTIFEKMSDLFQVAIDGISDLMLHLKNNIRKCMNSIAILILTNCLMPVLTFFVMKWILKELFNIVIPVSSMTRRHHAATERKKDPEPITVGAERHEE